MTLTVPIGKYRPFNPVALNDRRWPNTRLERAPRWLSTDLRDGNQALFEPMDAARKLRLFRTLVKVGFTEIEVGFPAASQTDFDFVRQLIVEDHVPPHVTISVLTQAREDLVRRSIEALRGAPRATVHLYTATAPSFRRLVFGMEKADVLRLAVGMTRFVRAELDRYPDTLDWGFEFSPEMFSTTELDFALEVCNRVTEAWGASEDQPIILNLPATVEAATPNLYADQIEWMHRNLARRDAVILSVHPHNDRGTAVAAAELAMMAGAQRVEGCLFGNGERTGNVDLVTLALNLYSQGIDPGLDFSQINAVARTVEHCTQLPIHPRHPYVGDLVFTAFSGSHQDAIRKGLAVQAGKTPWEVPYLPIDPVDLGRSYDSIIRVNSQSGKGGIAFLLERHVGLVMSRRLQVAFSAEVQRCTDTSGGEVDAQTLWTLLRSCYGLNEEADRLTRHHHVVQGDRCQVEFCLHGQAGPRTYTGSGVNAVEATLDALGLSLRIDEWRVQPLAGPHGGEKVAIIEAGVPDQPGGHFGVGVDNSEYGATLRALLALAVRVQAVKRPPPGCITTTSPNGDALLSSLDASLA